MTKKRFDILMWGSLFIIVFSYFNHFFLIPNVFSGSVVELMNRMSWGLAIGILLVGFLDKIPREMVSAMLGKQGTFGGILRATGAGVVLDLCSHGILLVGMKLYQRGASLGQVMAFLIASPWNSISLTFILWALVGFWWMLGLLVLSLVVAVISGVIFEYLVKRGTLPSNPNHLDIPENYKFWSEVKKLLKTFKLSGSGVSEFFMTALKGSRMVIRWILFGVVLASLIRAFVSPELFQTLFGPSIAGLGMTILVATILEVCSEGSTPIAADILTRAGAPGNAFTFLMSGVSTDYTEMAALKETTGSWKISLFLPLVTLPQIIIIGLILNGAFA